MANYAIDSISKQNRKKRAENRKYYCEICKSWHLTSQIKLDDTQNKNRRCKSTP